MTETLWRVFGLVGMVIVGVFVAFLCYFIAGEIRENIAIKRRQYEYQHRFDKKPVAKCYCKDCLYRSDVLCDKFDRYVDQDFFCRHADPCDGKVK